MKRREILKIIGLTALYPHLPVFAANGKKSEYILKSIPKTGEKIPVIGMGTSRTFNVGQSTALRDERIQVLKVFFEMGGTVIDSSPMYGSSPEVLGYALKKLGVPKDLFAATKVWTSSAEEGKRQFKESMKDWGLKDFELYQIHNLVGWQEHLEILRKYKDEGKIRYIGITTSHGRRLEEFRSIMKKEPLDFIQVTYNLEERWNDNDQTLRIAKDKGIAVLANRPFQRGDLFERVKGKKLPEWAKEFDCETWSQFFLKWVVSHPSITCAIPATSKVEHMKENMGALQGRLPDENMRKKMLTHFQSL